MYTVLIKTTIARQLFTFSAFVFVYIFILTIIEKPVTNNSLETIVGFC